MDPWPVAASAQQREFKGVTQTTPEDLRDEVGRDYKMATLLLDPGERSLISVSHDAGPKTLVGNNERRDWHKNWNDSTYGCKKGGWRMLEAGSICLARTQAVLFTSVSNICNPAGCYSAKGPRHEGRTTTKNTKAPKPRVITLRCHLL